MFSSKQMWQNERVSLSVPNLHMLQTLSSSKSILTNCSSLIVSLKKKMLHCYQYSFKKALSQHLYITMSQNGRKAPFRCRFTDEPAWIWYCPILLRLKSDLKTFFCSTAVTTIRATVFSTPHPISLNSLCKYYILSPVTLMKGKWTHIILSTIKLLLRILYVSWSDAVLARGRGHTSRHSWPKRQSKGPPPNKDTPILGEQNFWYWIHIQD